MTLSIIEYQNHSGPLSSKLAYFFTWKGRVGRAAYAGFGVLLFAVKHNIDRLIAYRLGYSWGVFNYWVFGADAIDRIRRNDAVLYGSLVAASLPFVWTGIVLTIRRLRDADLPLWLTVFFFVPFINLFFFLLLAIVPSGQLPKSPVRSASSLQRTLLRIVPDNEFGSAAMGVVVTIIFAVIVTTFSVHTMRSYGWGLFVGLPFFLGLNAVLIYGVPQPRSLGKCLLVALISIGLAGAALLALAVEGIVCLMMAFPLAIIIALFGGFIGFILQQRQTFSAHSFRAFALLFVVAPVFVAIENQLTVKPALYEVKSSIVINAKPENVWKNLVAFSDLPNPTEAIFSTGIAYPTHAKIEGSGVGAIRRCVFTTGEFVEPITVWDEPQLLKFDVRSQPRVMDELSPYRNLRPPHLDNYLQSRRGQFALTDLGGDRTLLEGTTWYQNRFWPALYWRLWSDYIIHKIHYRVLVHVKELSEKN
ncbi:MAG: DUF805 domain-containing protein [Pyrinomonadaceae bacterium]